MAKFKAYTGRIHNWKGAPKSRAMRKQAHTSAYPTYEELRTTAAARNDTMSKTEFRTDNIPADNRDDADYSMARVFNTFAPSTADRDRTEAVNDERKYRLSNAWKTPAGGPANPSAAMAATPEAAHEAMRNRLSNAWKDGR